MSKRKIKQNTLDTRAKVRMVLEAVGTSMTTKEITEHPLMKGVSGQSIAQGLRYSKEFKLVRDRWVIVKAPKEEPKVEEAAPELTPLVKPKMRRKYKKKNKIPKVARVHVPKEESHVGGHFRITKSGDLLLVVNGISLPVEFE